MKLKAVLGGLLFYILATGAGSAAILASWDAWGNSYDADIVATGFSANITNPDGLLSGFNATSGSTDGTFGTLSGAGTDTTALFTGATRNSSLETATPYTFVINISNTSGSSYDLDTLHLDYIDNSAWELNRIVYEDALGAQTTLATDLVVSGGYIGTLSWSNHDIEIGGLTLADGEAGKFIVTLTNTNYDRRSAGIDNIAITAIPESSTVMLLGLALLGLSLHRRR